MTNRRTFPLIAAAALLAACTSDRVAAPRPAANGAATTILNGIGSWSALTGLPVARAGTNSAAVGGKLYVLGGFVPRSDGGSTTDGRAFSFDPMLNTWTELPAMPNQASYLATAAVGGKIYAAGGCIYNADCRIGTTGAVTVFDPQSNTWSTLGATLNTPRSAATALDWNGSLWVLGGIGPCPPCDRINTVEVYSPGATSFMVRATTIPDPGSGAAFVALGQKLYRFGGDDGTDHFMTLAQEYDDVSGQWTTLSPIPHRLGSLGATAVNGIIYVIGGQEYDPTTGGVLATHRVVAYDPAANAWTDVADIPTSRYQPMPQAINGTIYVAGNGAGNTPTSANEAFTPPSPYSPPVLMGIGGGQFLEGLATITPAASDFSGAPLTFTVDFGDGTTPATGSCTPPSSTNTNCGTSFAHQYEAGSYTMTVTASDGLGSTSGTFPITVTNVAPMIGTGGGTLPGATLWVGNTFTSFITFTDPGQHETYTATVSWGDGTTSGPMTVPQYSGFSVNHTYTAACNCTFTVQVSDNNGGTSTATGTVVVQSSYSATQALAAAVNTLVSSGILTPAAATPLQVQLQNAMARLKPLASVLDRASMDAGGVPATSPQQQAWQAIRSLQVFALQVQQMIAHRNLAPDSGQPLVDSANLIITHIETVEGAPPGNGG